MSHEYDLIIDTREQKPLPFRKFVTEKLDFGDYAARYNNELMPIVFERKSGVDAMSTITRDHERFKNEMWRAL